MILSKKMSENLFKQIFFKPQKLKIVILLNEKIKKNWNIDFAYVSEHCASFGIKFNSAPFEWGGSARR